MGRLLWVGVLLLAGCQSVVGPLRRPDEEVYEPGLRYRIEEQKRRERDLLAYPETTPVLPRTGAEIPNGR